MYPFYAAVPPAPGHPPYELAAPIEKQAAGIIQVDVGQCGGILEAKKIAALAEAHHALIAPHMYVGPIAAAGLEQALGLEALQHEVQEGLLGALVQQELHI